MKTCYFCFFLVSSIAGWCQSSITEQDIAIRSQLTLLDVGSKDLSDFRSALGEISTLSKRIKLPENYDWLTYKSDNGQFFFVHFSMGLADLLTLEQYKGVFNQSKDSTKFSRAFDQLGSCDLRLDRNFVIEMILPWSSVEEISVNEHPLATMTEFTLKPKQLEAFDKTIREMASLLKQTNYPYPLESNRGSVGAYGKVYLVWFYDQRLTVDIYEHLSLWMKETEYSTEWQRLMKKVQETSLVRKQWIFSYERDLSY